MKIIPSKATKILFHNRGALIGLAIVLFFTVCALLAGFIAPYDPTSMKGDALTLPPGSVGHLLGTDDLGRDTLSRLLYGSRLSLIIGACVVVLSATIGTLLGLIAGFFGGFVDRLIMRVIDILMSLPSILLAIVVVSVLGPGITNAIIAVAVVSIPSFTRIVRGSVLAEKSKEYVTASISFGASPWRTLFKEVFPNCVAPLIVQATLGFSDGILNAAALGFLGLGAEPPTPEWGTMLADSRAYIESAPWLMTLPGVCILAIVLGFNLFGDGLRDALDPRLKR